MLALTIAIVALAVAVYAARLGHQIVQMHIQLERAAEEAEEEEADESQELWLSEGEWYAADKAKLEALVPDAVMFGAVDGVLMAVVPSGAWSVHKLLSEQGKAPKATKLAAVPQ